MKLVRADDDARRPRVHQDLGRRPRRRPAHVHRGVNVTDHQPVDPADECARPAVDPALAAAVLEIEQHIARAGWDQPARLYALVDTADLVAAQSPRWPPRWASTSPAPPGRSRPVEQDARPRPAAGGGAASRSCWPERSPAAPRSSSGSCCRPSVDDRSRTTPSAARGVRPRAPRPPGGADRGRRDARRGDVLRAAAARPRRRPVGGRRRRPGARRCWSCCAARWT